MTDPREVEKKKFLNLTNSSLLRSLQAEEQSWAAKVHTKSDGAAGEEVSRWEWALPAMQDWPLKWEQHR